MAIPITILKNILDFNRMHIEKAEMDTVKIQKYGVECEQTRINVHARPFKRSQCKCPVCGKKCAKDGHKQENESSWRAPNLNGVPVYIKYQPQRILCPEHGALNECIPWSDGTSRFTAAFNDEIAWLVCQMSKTAVCEFVGVNWRTVGNCIKAAQDRLEPDVNNRIHDKVRRICVDETAYEKGHKYITVIYDMDKNRVIWVHKGHETAVFAEFCELLSQEERDRIEIVAGDGAAWIDACMHYFPNATRCIDFFHVAQWANKALDDVRISVANKAKREYEKLRSEYTKAELEAAQVAKQAEQEYKDALFELAVLPRRGRPSARKLELKSFITEYELAQASLQENAQANPNAVGRPKKNQLSPEHEASLKLLSEKIADFKGAKFALGHNPENCTDGQNEKIKLIENDYPDLYRAYQLKESLRLILHMKDEQQAETELVKWIESAIESGIKAMKKLAEKIRDKHMKNILNSIRCQANSAKSEATNATIKVLIKLARGFRNTDNMIALIYLKCSDLVIPLHNRPQPTKEYLDEKRKRATELRRLREEHGRGSTKARNKCSEDTEPEAKKVVAEGNP